MNCSNPEDSPPDHPTFEEHGYSAESLKMLKTAEGQNNAIFACYGSAAQRAQNFENGLAKFLATYNKMANQEFSVEALESRNAELSRKTMGQLLNELKKTVKFPDDTYAVYFQDALAQRNFLMHEFFLERGNGFETEESRLALLAELTKIEMLMNRARIAINAMRIALSKHFGIDPGDNA